MRSVDRVLLLLEAIAADPAADHSTEAMARRAGIRSRHLNRLFAEHVGMSPARHVERVRIAAAQRLLSTTAAPLPEIATRAGFGSAETMRRAFRRNLGVSPGAYRSRAPMSESEGRVSLRPRAG